MTDVPQRPWDDGEAARRERERGRAEGGEPDSTYHGEPFDDGDGSTRREIARRTGAPARRGYDGATDDGGLEQAGGAVEPDVYDDEFADGDGWYDDEEVALGTRRLARRDRVRRAPRADPAARPGARRGRRRHSRIGVVLALLMLAIAATAIWFGIQLFQPFRGSSQGTVTVTVPPHSSATQIGDILARDGVVPSGFFFNLRAMLAGDRGKLLSGTYHLQRGMGYGAALKALTTPPPAAKVSNLTIVEGRTRSQIDALLRAQNIGSGYLAATRHSPLLNPTRYGAPAGTPSLEGFLFPDTYQLRDPISISALVADQLKTFRREFAKVDTRSAESRQFTPYQLLIIASMVQAEVPKAADAPLVASVIYNRLADQMPLQIDATTRYATGNYTRPLTVSELNSPSPYNTRTHPGLPPTPIDNPGLAAIQAAAHPANTNYLYFVVKPCGNGRSVFTASYSEFLADVQQYYSARQQQGGRSPVHC